MPDLVFQAALIFHYFIIMNESRHDVNTLTTMIESIEGRITALMEEELREKVEQQKLLDAIKLMEEKSQSKSSTKQRLLE